MRFAPLTYRIAMRAGAKTVRGYAIQLPAPFTGLRLCVRDTGVGWAIDHYDSGCGFGGPVAAIGAHADALAECRRWAFDRTSRARCVDSLVRYLEHARNTGVLERLFKRHGFGWCVAEAGLRRRPSVDVVPAGVPLI